MTVVVDNFDRADGGLGSNWTAYYGTGGGAIVSNAARASTSGQSEGSYWSANTFGPDQISRIILGGTIVSDAFWSVGCRLRNGTSTNGYRCSGNNGTWYITRVDGGTGTDIATGSASFAAGDVVECRAVGNLISLYKNGALVASQTDSTYLSGGAPGLEWFYSATPTTATEWLGSDGIADVPTYDVSRPWLGEVIDCSPDDPGYVYDVREWF